MSVRFLLNVVQIIYAYVAIFSGFKPLFKKFINFFFYHPLPIFFKNLKDPVLIRIDKTLIWHMEEVSKVAFEQNFMIHMLLKNHNDFIQSSFIISLFVLICFSLFYKKRFSYLSVFGFESIISILVGLVINYFIWRNFAYVPEIELKLLVKYFLYQVSSQKFSLHKHFNPISYVKSVCKSRILLEKFKQVLIWLHILAMTEPYNYKDLPIYIKELFTCKEYEALIYWIRE